MNQDREPSHLLETPPNLREQEAQDTERDASNAEQAESRQLESKRKRTWVLVGSAILQLPIWGMPKSASSLQCHSYMRRLRHELWGLSRILFWQLDAARKS